MASLSVFALILSTVTAEVDAPDSALKVIIKNSAVADPLKKPRTLYNDISADSLDILKKHYESGYFKAQVHIRNLKQGVEYLVDPGPRTVIRDFAFVGNRVFTDDWLKRELPYKVPDYFSRSLLVRNINHLVDIYNNAGFPFARISISDSTAGPDTSVILYFIDEGPLVELADLLVTGNRTTKEFVVKKNFGLKRNTIFNLKMISRRKKRLLKTGLFNKVEESVVTKDGQYYLKISVQEQKRDYIEGFLEYQPEPVDWNFDLTINFFNLLGTGRGFFFNYDYQGHDFGLSYYEPWLIFPNNIRTALTQETYETGRKIRGEIKLMREVIEDIGLTIGWGLEDFQGEKMQFLGLGAYLDYENFYETLQVEFGFSNTTYQKTRLRFDGLEKVWFFQISNHYAGIFADSIKEYDLFRCGGARTVRGYWEDEFQARSLAWINLNFKKLPIYPFFDYLVVLDRGLFKPQGYYSYGVGFEARSGHFHAAIDFGFPGHRTWRQGKVHLRIERRF